jgi:uncharacterized protein (DUF2141 family)
VLGRLISGACAVLLSGMAAQAADVSCTAGTPNRLNVRVSGVQSATGLVTVSLYSDDPGKFLHRHGSIGSVRVPAQSPTTQVCVALPAPGKYAVAVYHDLNGDRKLNLRLFLPAEPFALSNNPPPRRVFPQIGPSLFTTHEGENSIHVSLEKAPKDGQKPPA